MKAFSKTMTAIEYLTVHVERYRTFSYQGHHATGNIIPNCVRGIDSKIEARYPETKGMVFVFNWDRENNKVLNPVLARGRVRAPKNS